MLIPVGPHNPAAMKAKVQAISPKGKTPLSEAVRQAAQALRYTEERATVVLVSDGLETCDIDPCQLAAELAMSGVDFTVHVIGFDISQEDQERLRCLADKTGGLFLAAGSAGALRDALLTTVAQVKAPLPPVQASVQAPASVDVAVNFDVQWQGPKYKSDYISIAHPDQRPGSYVNYTYTREGKPLKVRAPSDPGTYEVRYILGRGNKLLARTTINIMP